MTEYFNQALQHIDRLTVNQQALIADAILNFAENAGVIEKIPDDHRESVLRGLAQVESGQFASEEEVQLAFARFQR